MSTTIPPWVKDHPIVKNVKENASTVSAQHKRLVQLPRMYANVVSYKKLKEDNEILHLDWSSPEKYEIVGRVGRGRYSEVFSGVRIMTADDPNDFEEQEVIIKVLKPVKRRKIIREIRMLRLLHGCPNIISLQDICKDRVSRYPSLIFERVRHDNLHDLLPQLDPWHHRFYVFQLLLGLNHAHSYGVMHRDIKPGNLVIRHDKKQLIILDWGLAEFYIPGHEYTCRVASRYYKAPELLLEHTSYDYAIDIWSVGVILAGLVFNKEPFFFGEDNQHQMSQIFSLLGSKDCKSYIKKYDLVVNKKLIGNYNKQEIETFSSTKNPFSQPDIIDLIKELLQYDPSKRPGAFEALLHPAFNPIWDWYESNYGVQKGSDKVVSELLQANSVRFNNSNSKYKEPKGPLVLSESQVTDHRLAQSKELLQPSSWFMTNNLNTFEHIDEKKKERSPSEMKPETPSLSSQQPVNASPSMMPASNSTSPTALITSKELKVRERRMSNDKSDNTHKNNELDNKKTNKKNSIVDDHKKIDKKSSEVERKLDRRGTDKKNEKKAEEKRDIKG